MSAFAASLQSLSSSSSSPRLRNRTWIARIGLSTCLVIGLMAASSLYIGGVVINERSIHWWFHDQYYLSMESVDLDAPGLHRPLPNISTNNAETPEPMPVAAANVNSTTGLETAPDIVSKNGTVRSEPTINIQNDEQSHGEEMENEIKKDNQEPAEEFAAHEGNNTEDDGDDDEEDTTNESSEDTIPPTNNTTIITTTTMHHENYVWNRPSITTLQNRTILPFEKQEGVVIVTKIHGPHQIHVLKQALCLLHVAYNRRPKYDIVVFTTVPVLPESIAEFQTMVYPVNISFVVDNRGLQQEIAALSPVRYQNFLQACKVDRPDNLTWWSQCPGRIAYNWQAEFRAWHLWKHPALAPYQWMMWLDADAFCTKVWTVDPIQVMIENDLVVLFDNWPKGHHAGLDVNQRIWDAFGVYICSLRVSEGHFYSKLRNTTCRGGQVGDIHGFFHITNMDFYRSDIVQKWAEIWIGDGFLQRRYDDQSALTIPAAILAPEKAWDMRRNKIRLDVYHNFDLDGRGKDRVGGFKKFWRKNATSRFPEAVHVCPITASN